jgi:hypothetical protein
MPSRCSSTQAAIEPRGPEERRRLEPRPSDPRRPLASKSRARFALLCDDTTLDPWAVPAIELLQAGGADLVAVLVVDEPGFAPTGLGFAARGYVRRRQQRRATAAVPVADVAPGIPRVDVSRTVDAADAHVRALGLDFALAVGVDWPSRRLVELPHGGIWAFDFDLTDERRLGLDEVRRVLDGRPVVEIALLRLEGGGASTLRRGVFRGDGRDPHRARQHLQAESGRWPALVVAAGADDAAHTRAVVEQPEPAKPLTTVEVARFLAIRARNHVRAAYDRFFRHPQWNIGIVDSPIHAFLDRESDLPIRWYPLSGRSAFLADPFGVRRESDGTVLCEHFAYRRGRGTIRAIEVTGGEFAPGQREVLRLPSHLSYPCTVEHAGKLLCIPEALQTNEIALFELDGAGGTLTRVASIVTDVAAMDPTLFQHAGRWWLFYVDGARGTEADLHVWHAPAPDGPWHPHRSNPVKTDVTSARPAGLPFVHEGALYRPAQDCSQRYGARVVLNRVTTLSAEKFREEPVSWVAPRAGEPYPAGRHTLTSFGEHTLIDGHRFVFVPVALGRFLRIWGRDLRRAARPSGKVTHSTKAGGR